MSILNVLQITLCFCKLSVYFLDDTTDERLGRALRRPNEQDNEQDIEPDSLSQSLDTHSIRLQNTHSSTQSQTTTDHDAQMEGGNINKIITNTVRLHIKYKLHILQKMMLLFF